MADFPITRPESITPTSNTGEHDSQRNDARRQRRARPSTPEVTKPPLPDDPHEEDNNHQLDELA